MISRIKGLIASSMQLSTNNTASPAMAGDVAYWDGSKVKTTPLSSWNTSLGTPVGVVVIPEGFAPDGKARIIGLKSVDENGNQSSLHLAMRWSNVTGDTSLTNFTKVPTTDNAGSTSIGSNSYGYLPSDLDVFTGATSYVDTKAKYKGNTPMTPSPYLGELPNPEYYKTISGNNALSDFNGLSNTQTLVGLGSDYVAANAAWKYKDGTSNLQWYLPAMGELGYLMPRLNEINSVITALGGVVVPIFYFWSSSEYNSYNAYRLSIGFGYVDYKSKCHEFYSVRPFAILDDGEESVNLITFYVSESGFNNPTVIEYTAEEGMTWEEWIDSEYNTSNLYIDEIDEILYVLTPDGLYITTRSTGSSVRSSDVIINGERYYRG